MLVHDGHFCPSLKTFPSSLQTDEICFKSPFSMFLFSDHNLPAFREKDSYKTQT